MSSSVLPHDEKVDGDSFDPSTLPRATPSAHILQQNQNSNHGHGGPKSSESDHQQSEWHEKSAAGKASTIGTAISLLKFAILPIVAAAYLGFCYAVQKRIVVVDGKGIVDTSPDRICEYSSVLFSRYLQSQLSSV
ncbi:hypothetical protein BDN72DRAFT_96856 [Pluteus cervinus]|uniref:Uncharacterized protein n=1 Tax=Pluteus cervinus TaxID=181527 RepID=A0ACD3APF0_9AGAR|nr:hypothetical protein BDN72DRAFT_96856 [Pluteus cervinus]